MRSRSYSPILLRANCIDVLDDARSAALCEGNLCEVHAVMGRGHRWVSLKNRSTGCVVHRRVTDELSDHEAAYPVNAIFSSRKTHTGQIDCWRYVTRRQQSVKSLSRVRHREGDDHLPEARILREFGD